MAKITWRAVPPEDPIYNESWTVGPVKGIRPRDEPTTESFETSSNDSEKMGEDQVEKRWKAYIEEDYFTRLFEWLRLDGLDITFEDLEWLWDALFEVDADFLGDLTGHALFTRMGEVTIDCYCPPGSTTLFRQPWDLGPVLVNYEIDDQEFQPTPDEVLLQEHGENPDKKWKKVFTTAEMRDHFEGFRADNPDLTWKEFEDYIESNIGD